jgi:Na+/H+-dicarboxylate symporter
MTANAKPRLRLSLASRIFLGLGLGIIASIVFGETLAFLDPVGTAFIQLLKMTVLPYIIVTLVASLGSLHYAEAKSLAMKVGGLLLVVWAITLTIVAVMPLALPSWQSASFFSTSLVEQGESFDFMRLYIPANPFHALSNNTVPAVVLFGIALGLALMGMENKQDLLRPLKAFSTALTRVTQYVINLTPYGVFAITASVTGTMSLEELGRLQVYLLLYVVIAAVMTFWVLPALITSLTPLRYGEVVGQIKDVLVTAFATGSLFIILPILAEKCKALLQDRLGQPPGTASTVDAIIPISFTFPNAAKLLTLSFVPFAAWFAGTSIPLSQTPTFLLTGLVSAFAKDNIYIPFLLDLTRTPADMFRLYLVTGIINSRFGTLLAAMHIVVVALLGTCAIGGLLTMRWTRVLRYGISSAALTGGILLGLHVLFSYGFEDQYRKHEVIASMQLIRDRVPTTVHERPPPTPPPDDSHRSRLDAIRSRGTIRVGYQPDELPFSYFNAAGELVGFSIDMANLLAQDLGVKLAFVPIDDPGPVDYSRMANALTSGYCDIIMSIVVVTTARAAQMALSEPYMELTLGFAVSDHRREDFNSSEAVKSLVAPRIGIRDSRYWVAKVQRYLPEAIVIPLASHKEFFEGKHSELDAFVIAAEAGAAWSLLYPEYTVAIPHPDIVKVPVVYPLPRGQEGMLDTVNAWIMLRKADGTIAKLYDHWILGKSVAQHRRRWSVIHDVLHWVDEP